MIREEISWQKGMLDVCCNGIEVQIKSCAVTSFSRPEL